MPLVVDTFKAGTIEATQSITINGQTIGLVNMVAVDNTDFYSSSTVFSSFNKIGQTITPSENLNVFNLKSKMEMLETTEDIYVVFLGTLFSDTQINISNIKGSFNNVPDFLDVISTSYNFGALVEDAESPGDVYTIGFAGVNIAQVESNEYWVIAQFYTINPSELFIANVDLDIEFTSESNITFSNIINIPII